MKNREKNAEQILDVALNKHDIVAVTRNNEIVGCKDISCKDCLFRGIDTSCYIEREKWANAEYTEESKITERDSGFLRYLNDNLYIARDETGLLGIYTKKPIKGKTRWHGGFADGLTYINVSFPMIKWDDKEPWRVSELKRLETAE